MKQLDLTDIFIICLKLIDFFLRQYCGRKTLLINVASNAKWHLIQWFVPTEATFQAEILEIFK